MTDASEKPRSLVELLERSAQAYGERVFAVSAESGEALTFAALHRQARALARGLREQCGVKPGDHVALLLPNTVEFVPVYFGILAAGAVAVPVNIRLKPAELEFILADCQARALFAHPRTWPAAQAALRAVPALCQVLGVAFPAGSPLPEGVSAWHALLGGAAAQVEEAPTPSAAPNDVAAIIYTSGTTGRPKGAMLTHGNILFNIASTVAGHGLRPADVHLLIVPLFHVTGLNTIMPTALAQGARLVVSTQIDPEELLATLGRCGCTTFFGVPTTFYLLTSLKGFPAESVRTLRLICYSGAPMAPLTIRKLRELFPGVELHNFFGLTETTSVSTVLPDADALDRAESVGLPPPGVELAIVDDEARFLPAGEVGELVIRGPSVLKGYFNRPEATAEALRGGWFHTGDAALLDEKGYLYLRGRKKEMIIVAGENVYPIEVENALCAHPAVQEAAVFGRPDKILGEVVHAAVVLRPGAAAGERDLRQFVAERLATFKQPRTIRLLERLPRNPSGKVVKRELV